MEDLDFIIQVLVTSNLRVEIADLKIPLQIGLYCNQEEKEKKERKAINSIIKHWLSIFPEDSVERMRIGKVINELELV